MASLPDKFGPLAGIDNRDYLLYMEDVDYGPTGPTTRLLGHSLSAPTANLTDALNVPEPVLRNGRVKIISRPKRAAEETSSTFTLGFPSAIWTPAKERAQNSGLRTTFFVVYLCSDDSRFDHWFVMPDSTMAPPVQATDIIVTGEEVEVITETSELSVGERLIGYGIGYSRLYDHANAMNAVAFIGEDCPDADFIPGQGVVIGGGAGTGVVPPDTLLTEDRFATAPSALTTGGANDQVDSAILTDGDTIVVADVDDIDPNTGATGGLHVSQNRGTSFSTIAGLTDPLYGLAKLGTTYIAVGTDGTDGVIWLSTDKGNSWTEQTNSAIPTTDELTDIASDELTSNVYIVSDGGVLLKGDLAGGSLSLTDISSGLPGSPTAMRVAVLAEDHVIVAGASGYLAESTDGGTTWFQPAFGSSNAVVSVTGNRWRTVVVTASELFERTALNDNDFTLQTLQGGISLAGSYVDVAMNLEDDFNRFAAVTDAGEVVFGKPFYPNA